VRSEEFVTRLERTKLFTSEQLDEIRARLARDAKLTPEVLLDDLQKREWVTSWQAKHILKGETKFYLGRYKLLEKLGQGGMGTVYKAEKTTLGLQVALKVMSPKLAQRDEAKARFDREARAIATLKHPNIVSAIDYHEIEGHYVFEMEYVPGRNLSQWLRQYGPLPISFACECILQSALGLAHAHQHGIIHRDIKPSNLLVIGDNLDQMPVVKILDMGLARVLDAELGEGLRLTRDSQVLGTPDYMAPEQARSTQSADLRADLYSLGCSLFRVLTNEYPFPGTTPVQKLAARMNADPPRARSFRRDVPRELDKVIAKMMAFQRDDRYSSATAVAHALEPFSLRGASSASKIIVAPSTRTSSGATPAPTVPVPAPVSVTVGERPSSMEMSRGNEGRTFPDEQEHIPQPPELEEDDTLVGEKASFPSLGVVPVKTNAAGVEQPVSETASTVKYPNHDRRKHTTSSGVSLGTVLLLVGGALVIGIGLGGFALWMLLQGHFAR